LCNLWRLFLPVVILVCGGYRSRVKYVDYTSHYLDISKKEDINYLLYNTYSEYRLNISEETQREIEKFQKYHYGKIFEKSNIIRDYLKRKQQLIEIIIEFYANVNFFIDLDIVR
jgi:hypothetical protein